MGLEGIVSKRKDSAYRCGRSRDWLKMKNPACAAVTREGRACGHSADQGESRGHCSHSRAVSSSTPGMLQAPIGRSGMGNVMGKN